MRSLSRAESGRGCTVCKVPFMARSACSCGRRPWGGQCQEGSMKKPPENQNRAGGPPTQPGRTRQPSSWSSSVPSHLHSAAHHVLLLVVCCWVTPWKGQSESLGLRSSPVLAGTGDLGQLLRVPEPQCPPYIKCVSDFGDDERLHTTKPPHSFYIPLSSRPRAIFCELHAWALYNFIVIMTDLFPDYIPKYSKMQIRLYMYSFVNSHCRKLCYQSS